MRANNITRRAVLGGLAATTSLTAPIPAEASDGSSRERVNRIAGELSHALDEWSGGEFMAKVYPSKSVSYPVMLGQIATVGGTDAELLRLDKEMEAVNARMKQADEVCREICDRTGGGICPESQAAEDAFSAIVDEHWEIGRRIFRTPADTPEGMAVKLRAGERLLLADYLDERDDFISIAADIRRLAGETEVI